MVCHRDLTQYLVAIKSFTYHAPPKKIYVLDDGSLTIDDKALLESNIPTLKLLRLDDFTSESCPRGGCWERLLAVAALTKDDYVIQMDADTLTSGAINEVTECVEKEISFAISTSPSFRTVIPMGNIIKATRDYQKKQLDKGIVLDHVQMLAEASFDKLKGFGELKYIRGCAGFSGFAKGSVDTGFIDDVSSQMFDAIGTKWREWGSEQVMSNIVVANSAKATVLPHPKYSNCNEMKDQNTNFAHFIGICRFTDTRYVRRALGVIKNLRNA